MESRIGHKTREDRIFSLEDATDVVIKYEEHFDELENPTVKGKGKGKQKRKATNTDPENHISKQGVIEHHGVMFIYKQELVKLRKWFKQISGRLAQISFMTKGPGLIITNALAPHTWANGEKSRETAYEIRPEYFQPFTETLLEHKEGHYHIVLGDMNTRLHARSFL